MAGEDLAQLPAIAPTMCGPLSTYNMSQSDGRLPKMVLRRFLCRNLDDPLLTSIVYSNPQPQALREGNPP